MPRILGPFWDYSPIPEKTAKNMKKSWKITIFKNSQLLHEDAFYFSAVKRYFSN